MNHVELFKNRKFIPFTHDQLEDMRISYINGESTDSISHRFGVEACGVRRRLTAMGVTLRPRGRKMEISEQELMDAVSKRQGGALIKDLAKEYSCNRETMARYLREATA